MGGKYSAELITISDLLHDKNNLNQLYYRDLFASNGMFFPIFDHFVKEYYLLRHIPYPKDILFCITEQYINLVSQEYNFNIGTQVFTELIPKSVAPYLFQHACYSLNPPMRIFDTHLNYINRAFTFDETRTIHDISVNLRGHSIIVNLVNDCYPFANCKLKKTVRQPRAMDEPSSVLIGFSYGNKD